MIRVFIADDHAIVRHGLRQLIESSGDMQLAGEAMDGRELPLRRLRQVEPRLRRGGVALRVAARRLRQ